MSELSMPYYASPIPIHIRVMCLSVGVAGLNTKVGPVDTMQHEKHVNAILMSCTVNIAGSLCSESDISKS